MLTVLLLASALMPVACRQNARPPELFSPDCAEQTRGWTTEELADIAFEASRATLGREETVVRISQDGCEIQVSVMLNERYAGANFSVLVSAIDGSVLQVYGGE